MDINSYWENRATVRRYTDRPVSDELLADLMAKASHAPTTGNMQLYSVIITRNPEMKRLLAPAHFNQPSVDAAPVVLTVCADYNRFSEWCRQRKAVPGYDNFQSFIAALLDTALLAQQFLSLMHMSEPRRQ
ncbi:MAG: nitroreductase family protein, partial [Muribaculaceae bacterium]|nr:nitroreductase family protein [Muribaculaceae bacterium]